MIDLTGLIDTAKSTNTTPGSPQSPMVDLTHLVDGTGNQSKSGMGDAAIEAGKQLGNSSISNHEESGAKTVAGIFAGIGRPFTTTLEGATQLGAAGLQKAGVISPQSEAYVNDAIKGEQDRYKAYFGGSPSAQTGEALGNIAQVGLIPAGAGAVSALGRVAASTAGMSALGAVQPVTGDGSRLQNAAVGAVGGIAGGVLGEGLRAIPGTLAGIKSALSTTESKLVDKSTSLLDKISTVQDRHDAGELAATALNKYEDTLKSNYQGLYDKFSSAAGQDVKIVNPDMTNMVANTLKDYSDSIPQPVISRLGQFKPFGGTQDLTYGDANKLTQFINKRWSGTFDPAAKSGLSDIRNTLYDAMDKAGTGTEANSILQQARAARIKYAQVFGQNDLVNKVVTEQSKGVMKIGPDQLVDTMVRGSGATKNFEAIKSALLDNSTPENQAAWNAIQRVGLQQKLFGFMGKDAQGMLDASKGFNSQQFIKSYDSMGSGVIHSLAGEDIGSQLQVLRAMAGTRHGIDNTLISKIAQGINTMQNNPVAALAGAAATYGGFKHFTGE